MNQASSHRLYLSLYGLHAGCILFQAIVSRKKIGSIVTISQLYLDQVIAQIGDYLNDSS